MDNKKARLSSSNTKETEIKKELGLDLSSEKKDLKDFQSAVALSLLKYTADLEDVYVERRLASALLFLTHLSSEIISVFTEISDRTSLIVFPVKIKPCSLFSIVEFKLEWQF